MLGLYHCTMSYRGRTHKTHRFCLAGSGTDAILKVQSSASLKLLKKYGRRTCDAVRVL